MQTIQQEPRATEGLPPLRLEDEGNASPWEMVWIALGSLTANKMRSLLTMLGVIIGVMAVVALLSIGDGVNNAITGQLRAMGTNLLSIYPMTPKGVAREKVSASYLTQEDVDAIVALGLPLRGIASEFSVSGRITAAAADVDGSVIATMPDWFSITNLTAENGVVFGEEEIRTAAPVVVLGAVLKPKLFGNGDAVGQTIRVRGEALRVIGVLAFQGGLDNELDDVAYVPLTMAQQRLGVARTPDGHFSAGTIIVSIQEGADLSVAQARIATVLRERHHRKLDGSNDDFRVQDMSAIIAQATTILGALTLFLGSVAGISLLVGGIGIMNIMLVSVTERTKEIGLRKAVGARGWDILAQFIVEALVISVTGGLIGLGLGALIAFGVTVSGQLVDAPVTPSAVMLALGFSIAVGLFFGIYPAQRAARLNPIDALRFE